MTERRRRRGPRGDITAATLISAAEEVLDARGPDGLTLRAVAEAADVTPNVLYTYFDGMADLRHRVADTFLGRIDLSPLDNPRPPAGLRTFLRLLLKALHDSPGQARLLSTQRVAGEHALALNEALLDFFIDRVGHSPRMAAGMTTLLTEWVHGRVLLSPSNPATADFTTAMSRLHLEKYPRTTAMLSGAEGDEAMAQLIRITTTPIS